MAAINCDECTKEKCPQRLAGALCSINKDTIAIVKDFASRDPILIARNLAKILQTEASRYEKALKHEDIGVEEDFVVLDKKGEYVTTVKRKRGIDHKISNLALNILKGGKIINDIMNPPKQNALFQQNNQYNISVSTADEINALPADKRIEALKYIDDKLDANRTD